MRKLFLPYSASTPHQFRKALLCSASRGHCPSPCVSLSRLEREHFSSSSTTALDAAQASDAGSDLRNTQQPDGQDHDRNIREQDTSRTIAAPPPKLPYRFETGISLFAKRAPRPFPPPFLSPPSGSFSDPLSTHHQSRDRRPKVNGQLIKGWTNGDDAAFASEYFVGANDGVGAWGARPRGHAGLWARLILHFWAMAMSEDASRPRSPNEPPYTPDPIAYLEKAYEQTKEATSGPDWQGTTTATGAQLFYKAIDVAGPADPETTGESRRTAPVLYVTNLGDSQVMVVRPSSGELIFKTKEQWHWFDCPRQLGTNSPDTPAQNAVLDQVPIEEGDVVLAMSDGVIDNLWSHEIVENVSNSVKRWAAGDVGRRTRSSDNPGGSGSMAFVAEELMLAAKTIALDPFAESPFMEHAIDEGLPSEGGKLDDITVVAALCTRNDDV